MRIFGWCIERKTQNETVETLRRALDEEQYGVACLREELDALRKDYNEVSHMLNIAEEGRRTANRLYREQLIETERAFVMVQDVLKREHVLLNDIL